MKQGNQFYFTIQLEDSAGNKLDISTIKKIQFVIASPLNNACPMFTKVIWKPAPPLPISHSPYFSTRN